MKISLITACYNSEATIGRTLSSVAAQKGEIAVEHVIQDGGSTDGTLGMIENYAQNGIRRMVNGEGEIVNGSEPVRCVNTCSGSKEELPRLDVLFRSEPDGGFYDAINKGIERASGEVIGLINGDDWLADDQVLADVGALFAADSELDLVYGDLDYVDPASLSATPRQGGKFRDGRSKLSVGSGQMGGDFGGARQGMPFEHRVTRHWVAGEYSFSAMRNGWMPPHPTIYVRKRVFEEFGGYRLDLGSAADYEWIVRVMAREKLKCAYLPRVMVKMLVGGQSNESFSARLKANRNDLRAWKLNGLRPYPWFALAKPLRKIKQFF